MAKPREEIDEQAGIPPVEPKPDRLRAPRIIVKVIDGKPDFSRLDPEQMELLRAGLSEASAENAGLPPEVMGMLIHAIGSVEAMAVSAKTGMPRDVADRIVQPKPPLDSMLAETAVKVAAKHNLGGRYAEEIALLALLGTWQAGVVASVRMWLAEQEKVRKHETLRDLGPTQAGENDAGANAGASESAATDHTI